MFSKITKIFKKVTTKVKVDKVAELAKDTIVGTMEDGVDVVKSGVFGVVNGVFLKIIATVIFVVIILSAGCVGTNLTINKLTTPSETTK